MRTIAFISLILFGSAASAEAVISKALKPGTTIEPTVIGGIEGPLTIRVTNYSGIIEFEDTGSETGSLSVEVQNLQTFEDQPALLLGDVFEDFWGRFMRIKVQYPVPQKAAKKSGTPSDTYIGGTAIHHAMEQGVPVNLRGHKTMNTTGEVGSSHLTIRVPRYLLGHVKIITDNAEIRAHGFGSDPVPGFNRVFWIEAPDKYKLGEFDLYRQTTWTRDAHHETTCPAQLINGEREPFPYPFAGSF